MGTIVSPIGRGQGNEFLNKLEAAGLDSSLAQRVIDSKGNNLAAKVVKLIINGRFEPTMSHKRAREIMGYNFFGVPEAAGHFGVDPLTSEVAALSEIPWSEATLEECKETHILVAVFPISILEIHRKVNSNQLPPILGERLFYDGLFRDWHSTPAFTRKKGKTEWQLVRKTPVKNSTLKTWQEQQALLGSDEETPTARTMVYTVIGHFLATGERLFEKIYVRSSDMALGGDHAYIGRFDSDGLGMNDCCGDFPYDNLGLSAARKPT